jgi:hypothetical protein
MSLVFDLQATNGRVERLLYGLAWLLALTLPFESIRPLLRLPELEFTNLELLLAATAAVWLMVVWQNGAARERIRPLLWPIFLFAAVLALAAVAAPFYRLEAVKFAARLASGCFLLVVAATVVTSRERLTGLMWAISLGATVSALLGLAEWAGWRLLDPIWPLFKVGPSRIGGELRLSATFQFATIAAFYLEMTIPLMLALAAATARRSGRSLALAMAVVATVAVILTLTRSGILFLALLYTGFLVLAWRLQQLRPLAAPTAVAFVALVATVVYLSWGSAPFRARLLTENDLEWYRASYQVPPFLSLEAGQSERVVVLVYNSGRADWANGGEHAFALGYRWLDASGRPLGGPGHHEISLPHDVRPGEWVSVVATITAPSQAGNYAISWGMLQRHILWFHHRGVPDGLTQIHVGATRRSEPLAATGLPILEPQVPAIPVTVPRRELWRAAVGMVVERPWLGQGPDNFRRLYGRYLDLPETDERIHANNLYLELLATIGVAGTLAFAWLLWLGLHPLGRRLLRLRTTKPLSVTNREQRARGFATHLLPVALGGSLAAFFAHGLLDYFLGFTPTASLFWLVLGLAWVLPALHATAATSDPET